MQLKHYSDKCLCSRWAVWQLCELEVDIYTYTPQHTAAITVKVTDASLNLLPLSVAQLISDAPLHLYMCIHSVQRNLRQREEREVLRNESMILQCCNVPQVTAAERGEEGRSLCRGRRIDYGRDWGMYCGREGGRKRGWTPGCASGKKKKYLWGQPIRARVTPLSSGLASKSCAARQPTCLCSMNTWAHTGIHGQAKRHTHTHRKRNITLST